ncbi:hypothetical protein ACRE_088360 [Hapsidospora chrysogenum ATCC 11550]|uniref:Uncharacterized protein n=1 Tax=Hapsidospora chrysogenum (strain ATCC 11550 / CBS 779.69 / DSM 880 / IAM 14645 / JCM 23072 / IMI 49137) TaxID=857340 RepID=A0A086STP1_HAPC1|nr:hypothetical protein ACRE_088360 [Hapsidospora chrysogenum ATCC 11550]
MAGAPTTAGSSRWVLGEPEQKVLGSLSKHLASKEDLKAKLADQNFDMNKYPDPMLPRGKNATATLPPGVTQEMETGWLAAIEAAKKA